MLERIVLQAHVDFLRNGLQEVAVVVEQAGHHEDIVVIASVGFAEVKFADIDAGVDRARGEPHAQRLEDPVGQPRHDSQ